jgi:hypothetical protein
MVPGQVVFLSAASKELRIAIFGRAVSRNEEQNRF